MIAIERVRNSAFCLLILQLILFVIGTYYSHNYFKSHSCLINSTGGYIELVFLLVGTLVILLSLVGIFGFRFNSKKLTKSYTITFIGFMVISIAIAFIPNTLLYSQGC